jgi:hypothetical protein
VLVLVVVRLGVESLAKLAHSLAERARQLGQTLGAKNYQGHSGQKQQMDGTLDSH